MKKLLFLSLIFIAGCSSQPLKLAYDCPRISLPPIPALPVKNLNDNSQPDEVVKAYVASIRLMKDWSVAVNKAVSY